MHTLGAFWLGNLSATAHTDGRIDRHTGHLIIIDDRFTYKIYKHKAPDNLLKGKRCT